MQIRVRLASISLFAYLGALAGCGDDIPRQDNGGTGGSTGGSNGGSGGSVGGSGGSTGGSIAGSGGSGGSVGGRGGTGGSGGTGGTAGTGGRGGTGGSGGTGGTAGTGGRGGTGGTGGGGTGGGGTGGSTGGTGGGGTGGGGTGGSTGGTGGGGTGGSTAGTGGGGTGGGGTGGGGTGGQQCYTVAFTAPTNGATLTVADDTNMTCADGFQYNVRITTNAPAGTDVQLWNNGPTLISTAKVASGAATFAVQLASSGQSALSIQFPDTAACTDPTTRSTVTVNCPNTPPTCSIAQPMIGPTHPALNGVLFPAGDRANLIASYQVTFQVMTNAEDGQQVTLTFNNAGPPAGPTMTLTATASGGTATFVPTLSPDGTYQVMATCRNAAGVTGSSQLTSYPVDTTAPNLTVTQPAAGQPIAFTDLDSQGRFSVCGRTTSTDAAGLPASLGAAVNNLCVALGASTTCVGLAAVTAVNTDTCVPVTCPGGAPFDITVTLKDAAGNPTATTIQGVSCANMSAPVVTFSSPTAGQVLCPAGATTPAGCLPDADASTAGWQGTLTAHVSGGGQPITSGTVTFTVGTTTLGTGTLDASGNASLSGATLPEGSVTIVATTSNIPDRGVGTASVTVTVDLGVPDVVPNLTATVSDRRQVTMQLAWTAPGDAGGRLAGYDVRYAKVPITAANFDDTLVTAAVTYASQPAIPGQPDGIAVPNLYIENDYFFAVRGRDAAGNVGPIAATAAGTAARFLTTLLAGSGTDGIGQDVDGSGDFGTASGLGFTADGLSDLIVGGAGGRSVYIYFGSTTGYATTPSITITGALDFGQSVVNAGDLDGDGLNDIAVASPSEGSGRIYVYSRLNPPGSWGTTNAWPATLTAAQANYILTVDATFGGGIGSILPGGLARLGNFDGAGADDLGVGLVFSNSSDGVLLIVKGSATLASATIPNTNTIEIDGTEMDGLFGWPAVGIGAAFAAPAGPAVMTASLPANIYAFRGQSPAGVITAAAADDVVIGSAYDAYGLVLGFLGPLGASPAAVTIGGPFGLPAYVDVHLGTAATGPFQGVMGGAPAAAVRLTDSLSGNSFGLLSLGGGLKGTSQAYSVIGGDTTSDLVVAGHGEAGNPVYIVNGRLIPTLAGTLNVAAAQNQSDIVPPVVKAAGIPSAWGGYAGSTIIPDSDNDGYPDFAVGEYAPARSGRVVVFH